MLRRKEERPSILIRFCNVNIHYIHVYCTVVGVFPLGWGGGGGGGGTSAKSSTWHLFPTINYKR